MCGGRAYNEGVGASRTGFGLTRGAAPLRLHQWKAMNPSEYALARLRRLLRTRHDKGDQLNAVGARLLNRAIYSTYCDAVNLGAGDEARECLGAEAVTG